jgi:putative membrane protein
VFSPVRVYRNLGCDFATLRITYHASRITYHVSRITHHVCCATDPRQNNILAKPPTSVKIIREGGDFKFVGGLFEQEGECKMNVILSIIISLLLSALVIYIVGRLGLGLTVANFTSAIVAAAVIAIVSWLISWLLGQLGVTFGGGLLGAIIHLIIAAIVLMISDRFIAGMRVAGFTGALIAAIAIGVVGWLTGLIVAAIL